MIDWSPPHALHRGPPLADVHWPSTGWPRTVQGDVLVECMRGINGPALTALVIGALAAEHDVIDNGVVRVGLDPAAARASSRPASRRASENPKKPAAAKGLTFAFIKPTAVANVSPFLCPFALGDVCSRRHQ